MLFVFLVLALAGFALGAADDSAVHLTDWSGWGGNYYNNRWASQNSCFSSANIQRLSPHCQIPGPVSATPVTSGDTVYYPTWNGSFIALDYSSCKVLWHINVTALIEQYAPITSLQAGLIVPTSRTSPQIDDEVVFFATQTHALLIAVSRVTGHTLGMIQINSHPLAIVTMSPTFYNGRLFIGAASYEEDAGAVDPNYKCCTFVGNMVALTFDSDMGKFDVKWNISMIPRSEAAAGWSGSGIWGSQPSIDPGRGQVFIATGNTYSIPQSVVDCQKANLNKTASASDPCLPASVLQESVLAIDIEHGSINWARHLHALDAWSIAWGLGGTAPISPSNCPQQPGPDNDFGMAPTFVPGSPSTPHGQDTLVVGQKNANLYALSAQTGQVFWATATSPSSIIGGLVWGIAVDNERVYFTAENAFQAPWTLLPSGTTLNTSAYGAASLLNGSLLWEVPVPAPSMSVAPPTVVGDLVLVGLTGAGVAAASGRGSLLALETGSGRLRGQWSLDSGFHGGVAVAGGRVLFGTGYTPAQPIFNTQPGGSLHVFQIE